MNAQWYARPKGPAIEAAATQGLVNGWVMGMVMGALPRVLRIWKRYDAPLFGGRVEPIDGTWLSVIALNLGVALIWTGAVIPTPAGDAAVNLAGYAPIAIAWIPLLRRVWPTLVSA